MRQILLLATAAVSGFAGAAMWPPTTPEPAIRAQSSLLLDQSGKKRAEFGMKNGEAFLHFYDDAGRVTWEAPPRVRIMPVR